MPGARKRLTGMMGSKNPGRAAAYDLWQAVQGSKALSRIKTLKFQATRGSRAGTRKRTGARGRLQIEIERLK